MNASEIAFLTGQQALALFTEKKLSPVELMHAVIARHAATNAQINASTECYFEQALAQAKQSEQHYLNGTAKPLEGLPLAVKDEFRLKGTKRTSSSLVYAQRVDDSTDVIIQRLLDAGAICHMKTTTPEFCLLGSCHSRLWGTTHNPWNLDTTPGGSSGGSAAALAAGMTTLATGTDIGGSIRIPASQCGVVGYKPPYGRNPEIPVFNLDFYSHSGPMARSTADIALMQNVISGYHNQDIASLRSEVQLDTENVLQDLNGWKIAYSCDLDYFEIDESVKNNTLSAIAVLQNLGAQVEQVHLGWTDELISAVHNYWSLNWANSMAPLLESHRSQLTDYAIYFIEQAKQSTPQKYNRSIEVAVETYNQFGPMMDRYDLFVCPTLGTTQIPAEFTWPSSEVGINGQTKHMVEEQWSLTYPFNMLSRCPVISLPSGRGDNNVPTGIQLVGKTYDDISVIEGAKVFEKYANWSVDGLELDSRLT